MGNISWLAALLTTFLFIIVIGVPLYFIGSQVIQQAGGVFESLSEGGGTGEYIDSISDGITDAAPVTSNFDIKSALAEMLRSFTGSVSGIFTATLSTIVSFILVVLSLFYFLKDGEKWKRYIVKVSPLADTHDNRILTMLEHAV
ncbi:AI-2E family transporter, partial [Burkholderia anthinoferrum]